MTTENHVVDPGVQGRAALSPVDAAVPFWVTACVRLMPPRREGRDSGTAADKVFPAVQVLMADRLRGGGAAQVELDRTTIAAVAGYSSPKKITWITDYLERIGFLVVHRHGGGGSGRKPDTFDVYDRPPAHYIGPRTYAELVHALRDQNKTFANRLFVNAQVSDGFPNGNLADSARFPNGDLALNAQVSNGFPNRDLYQIDRSPISEREIGGSIEPVPGGAAMPPATGLDERLAAEVSRFYARLPWTEWAARQGVEYVLNEADSKLVAEAVRIALASGRMTFEQAEKIGPAALREASSASPARYVANAFQMHLDTWLARVTVILPEPDLLPLPGNPPSHTGVDHHAGVAGPERPADASDSAAEGDDPRGPVIPAHCGQCGNPALGDANPARRDVRHRIAGNDPETGQPVLCTCHPSHPDHLGKHVAASTAKEA